jgi:hypothetical protein
MKAAAEFRSWLEGRGHDSSMSSYLETAGYALFLPPQHRSKANAVGRLRFKEPFLEPTSPASRTASLPTDTVNLATLLSTHGRLRGKEILRT